MKLPPESPDRVTTDARRLYHQGVADGRIEGEARRAALDFWRGFVAGFCSAIVVLGALLIVQ